MPKKWKMNRVDKIHDRFVRKTKKEVSDRGVDRNIDLVRC